MRYFIKKIGKYFVLLCLIWFYSEIIHSYRKKIFHDYLNENMKNYAKFN